MPLRTDKIVPQSQRLVKQRIPRGSGQTSVLNKHQMIEMEIATTIRVSQTVFQFCCTKFVVCIDEDMKYSYQCFYFAKEATASAAQTCYIVA